MKLAPQWMADSIEPIAGSGVPKVGEPERSDMLERKLP
jgi:hypothetical protein